MTRSTIILAGLLLGASSSALAQNSAAPANIVTPAPPPREGTVGPEQLRDFALPGTRQGIPSSPAEARPAPATPDTIARPPVARPVPSANPTTPSRAAPRAAPTASPSVGAPTLSEPSRSSLASPPPATIADTVPLPLPQTAEPPRPIVVTQTGEAGSSLLRGWWPWLLLAMLGGIGLAVAVRQGRRPAPAGHGGETLERVDFETPAAAPLAVPTPAPPADTPATAMPAGLVTTRLRSALPAPPRPVAAPAPVNGAVVSRRLRGWIEIELAMREILFDEAGALLRVDLVIANRGTASARDIALEAVTTNASENQRSELAAFFERPAAPAIAVAELDPLGDTILSHELRMPRSAIRAYEAQGRTLFVPVVAFNASYRTGLAEGRTSAAFLVGREVPGSDKLAPLLLPQGAGRLLGLGVRRLEECVRR